MNIAIFGLGYVGCVTTACLARDGHNVIGVDIKREKIEALQSGKSPIIEPRLSELIRAGTSAGLIEATDDAEYAVQNAETVMVCVGTPSKPNGDLDLTYVKRVCKDIGSALRHTDYYTVVAIRSTILPGTAEQHLIPILEDFSGKQAGDSFGFCVNPEFLREGSAVLDFDNPPYTVIGQLDEQSGKKLASLYGKIDAPLYRIPLGAAEMVKYTSNAFHALKIVFANEIGNLCQMHGVDSHIVMDIFVQDTKLNLSPSYLKPGFAFGGSCLGKDLRALLSVARHNSVDLPVLESILPSNKQQTLKALNLILNEGRKKVGLVGLSFKANTDDLRESPSVELAERLIGKGFDVRIYDREVSLSRLHGSNRAYIDRVIPHIGSLMCSSLKETIQSSEIIVVTKQLNGKEHEKFVEFLQPHHVLIDLVRLNGRDIEAFEGKYRGICW